MTQEALKLALEFIERVNKDGWILADFEPQMYAAITAIKEALAQPERDYERGFIDGMQKQMQSSVDKAVNRMAQPQEPVGRFAKFTDGIWRPVTDYSAGVPLYTTPPQRTEQEPVGQLLEEAYGRGQVMWFNKPKDQSMLYTSPPQRSESSGKPSAWVGLTDEEVRDLWSWSATSEAEKTANTQQHAFAKAIEAKLKELNT